MAAGLGFKDFVTGEVLTAADVDGYLMQGIWVFDDAAARDAAVTSPQEGNACYLKDTNEVLTYSGSVWVAVGGGSPLTTKGDLYGFSTVDARIPIGANDTVLTADSAEATGLKWATPASGGGMTLLETLTLSGSSVTSSSIAGTYKNLQVIVRNFKPATDNTDLNFRYNSDTNTRYKQSTTMGQSQQSFNSTSLQSNNNADNSTAPNISVINIYDYANTDTWKFAFTNNVTADGEGSTANVNCYNFWQVYNQTSAITTLTFFPSSGNFTSGSILIYGVK
jgi:hypothetical protein